MKTLTKREAPTQEEQKRIKEEKVQWAKERLADPNTLIVDVETTGLLTKDPKTEVVSISIINTAGIPVLSCLVNPGRPIPLEVQKVHGIDDRMVKDCPPWSIVGRWVTNTLLEKHVVCFNAGFDVHLITTLFQRYEQPIPEFEVSCAMEAYSAFVGEWSKSKGDYKWQKLPKLAYGKAHDSLIDCQSTLLLLKKMAGDFSSDPDPNDIQLDF